MLHLISFLIAVLQLVKPPATQPANDVFPASWQGTWHGPATVSSPGKPPMQFEMELVIAPTEDPAKWKWTIKYIDKAHTQERPYELIIVDADKGEYKVDEKQGIIIPSRFISDALLCEFEVMSSRIVGSYRKVENKMIVELITIDPANSATSGGDNGIPSVTSYTVHALQRATLTKQ